MQSLPRWALALRFIDAVNGNDVARLASVMAEGHTLKVFDGPPLTGREANIDAWHGYCSSWPDYVISARRMNQVGDMVAVLGHTTGSHLDLPDEEESQQTLIWLCRCRDGADESWELLEDTAEVRRAWGLE